MHQIRKRKISTQLKPRILSEQKSPQNTTGFDRILSPQLAPVENLTSSLLKIVNIKQQRILSRPNSAYLPNKLKYGQSIFQTKPLDLLQQKQNEKITFINMNLKEIPNENQKFAIKQYLNKISIRILSLQNNQIKSLSSIEQYCNLIYLDLNTNRISEIVGLNLIQHLKVLILSNNLITSIQNLPTGLLILDLQNNKICRITNLDNLIHLKVLNLNNNFIQQLQGIENLTSLQKFHLDNNKIDNLSNLPTLLELQYISATGNQITKFIDLKTINRVLPKIVEIRLRNNPLTQSLDQDNYLDYLITSKTARCYSLESKNYKSLQKTESVPNLNIQLLINQQSNIQNSQVFPTQTQRIQLLTITGLKNSFQSTSNQSYSRQLLNEKLIQKLAEKRVRRKSLQSNQQIKEPYNPQPKIFQSMKINQLYQINQIAQCKLTSTKDEITSNDYFCDRHDRMKINEIKQEFLRGKRPYKSYIKLKSNILYCYGNPLDIHTFLINYMNSAKFRIICQITNEKQEDSKKVLFYKACFGFCHVEDIVKVQLDQEIISLHLKNNNISSLNQIKLLGQRFSQLKRIKIQDNEVLNSPNLCFRYILHEMKQIYEVNDFLVSDNDIQQSKRLFTNFKNLPEVKNTENEDFFELKFQNPKQQEFDSLWDQYLQILIKQAEI